jgi:hypothetical protein
VAVVIDGLDRAHRFRVQSTRNLIAILALSSSVFACMDGVDDAVIDEDQAFDDAYALVPRRASTFIIESKSFIANIADSMVGSFGLPDVDENLFALAGATNLAFSENPLTGAQNKAQFRVWGHIELDVVCDGATVISNTLLFPKTDVGFEGFLKGELDAIQSRVSGTAFSYQVSGRPNIVAEPAFQLVFPRTNRTIWYRVNGHVSCNANAEAFVTVDSVQNTAFPSVRVFATRVSGGVFAPEGKIFERMQGKFTELWRLAAVPRF